MKSVLLIEAKEVLLQGDRDYLEIMEIGKPPEGRTVGKISIIRMPLERYQHPQFGLIKVAVSPEVQKILVDPIWEECSQRSRELEKDYQSASWESLHLKNMIQMWRELPWYTRIWKSLKGEL